MSSMVLRAFAVVLLCSGLVVSQQPPDFIAAQTEAVKFLGELVKIDTSNPPGQPLS